MINKKSNSARFSLFIVLVVIQWLSHPAMAIEGSNSVQEDRADISQLILHWGYFRDHGMWPELAETFHPEGSIQVTWYTGPFTGFVEASRDMAARGAKSVHVMNPSIIDVNGDRAISITPVKIMARAKIALGVEVDLVSEAQFFDFVERRDGEWRILRRVCIYQKDRMDSVLPSLRYWLLGLLMPTGQYDPAYKHLALALSKQGYEIKPGQVVDQSESSAKLYAEGQAWLRKK